jgi:cold shock CspA family protein
MQGTCIRFDRARGFGFIVSSDDPTLPDIFYFYNDIEHNDHWRRRFLLPGIRVQFDAEPEPTENDPDRLRAKHVKVIPPITIAIQRSPAAWGGVR